MKEIGLPKLLSLKVKKYFEYMLNNKSMFDEEKILAEMSEKLRTQFLLEGSIQVLKKVDFLKDNGK